MNTRTIFHVDMDAFFASIEIVRNPALRGKAVIVGGQPDRRGVVSTCSYEARAFGVRSAMPLSEARRRCPHAIFLEGNYHLYRDYSEQVMQILRKATPLIQVVSIDEAYLDVTEPVKNYPDALALAWDLQKQIYTATQLTCSIGIGSNKLIAKIASKKGKPKGTCEVVAGTEAEFLAPLPIRSIPGIGGKTEEMFHQDGIQTIGDMQKFGLDGLMQLYGPRGYSINLVAMGRDNRPVEWEDQLPKSIGAETTFERDLSDKKMITEALNELVKKSWNRLRRHNMRTRAIILKLRDHTFKTITRSHMLFADTQDFDVIQQETQALFNACYSGSIPLRLIGISLHKLTDEYWQPVLWDWEAEYHGKKAEGGRMKEEEEG
jgi:nucleotidyltransferase/DNA polymerase involved in DNA repair